MFIYYLSIYTAMTHTDNIIRIGNEVGKAGNKSSIHHRTWVLPDSYDDLPPKEKQDVLRDICLRYIEKFGPSAAKVVTDGIGAPNHETVKKSLDYLVATRHLWAESFGGKMITFMPNYIVTKNPSIVLQSNSNSPRHSKQLFCL